MTSVNLDMLVMECGKLFGIAFDVLNNLLSTWVEVRTIARIDKAMASSTLRAAWLHLLSECKLKIKLKKSIEPRNVWSVHVVVVEPASRWSATNEF